VSAGDIAFAALWLVVPLAIGVVLWRLPLQRRLSGRRWPVKAWTSVWVDQDRIVAEGIADGFTLITERFSIDLNGRPVRMIVVQIDVTGNSSRWQAQDVASYLARCRVQGIGVRGA